MPKPHRKLVVRTAVLGGLVVLAGLCAVIPVERRLAGNCLLSAATRWTLTELRPGTFESKGVDVVTDQTFHYHLYQVERPAFMELKLEPFPTLSNPGVHCSAGQLVAKIQSTSLELALAERSTALRTARARLVALRGGAKPEEVERARIAVEQADAALRAYQPHYERQKQLSAEDIVSVETWEEVAAKHDLLQLDLQLAQAELRVLTSSARPEEIQTAEVTIAALEQELDAVEAMLTAQEIHTPISGRLRQGVDATTMLTVDGLDSIVVRILVPQRSYQRLRLGQPIRVFVPGVESGTAVGKLVRIDRRAVVTMAGSFIEAYGLIENSGWQLDEGMQGRARLYCGRTSLLSMLWQDVRATFKSEIESL